MPERDDAPLEPPDRSSYKMPRLPMVRRLMGLGILLFIAGVAVIAVEAISGLQLFVLASSLAGAGLLFTAIGFFAETFAGARLKPEDDGADKPRDGGGES